jgi:dolichyl-phosphate-mannose--protein O-mannosyl transferase
VTEVQNASRAGTTPLHRIARHYTDTAWRTRRWLGALVAYGPVIIVAAFTRLFALGNPARLVFDETYYVKDAWSLWNLGYEGTWPDGINPAFESGDVTAYTTTADFMAHPPLGKWIIGAGMWLVGPDNPVGWRISTAVFGIIAVLLTIMIAHRILRSHTFAALAGYFVAIDGIAITLSRNALLDQILTVFVLGGILAVMLDRAHTNRRLQNFSNHALHPTHSAHSEARRRWGPLILWRPWLLTAGILLGAATAVKWSGLYVIAAAGLWVVIADLVHARRAGVKFWVKSSTLRHAPLAALHLLPAAALTYLASWTGWFVTTGGYNRHWADSNAPGLAEPWASLAALGDYHSAQLAYHLAENTPHGYQANPLTWPLMVRPTAFYFDTSCGTGCTEYITSVANPALWWAGVAALGWLAWLTARTHTTRYVPLLVGIAATYLPWVQYQNRTVFQFYTVLMEPFLMIALAAALLLIAQTRPRVVTVFVRIATGISLFFLPVWWGTPIPLWFAALHYWFPTWV